MKRDWTDARAKVERERVCRVDDRAGACAGRVEAAHVIGREYDRVGYVHPSDIVPLCTTHHQAYDAHRLDLLPYLTLDEQAAAVAHVGIARAVRRITSGLVRWS